mmetsp:Transcript_24328/g.62012  ORF Transcript_24328/g.62012 Transcript_24328/m.62012 type:complete len:220 (+) Transcript_24328:78-737(+)|eukprot:CAMPEP_0183407026 /NCGR_PEP_ID=MMETSP0370-20130417/17062_1 /TAXON_ID=268820 /ORGANISM="Peridinium aciculiferum, Strain PAER-2" /LENGTH=219 /DNA_ID=CAMNT_0025589331 /DNA_START=64 /DNA_END=723 /DNA_ORIENTATION=+
MGACAGKPDHPGSRGPLVMPSVARTESVKLHIYDVGRSQEVQVLNRVLRIMGTGMFHCAVEVYGLEWSFRGTPHSGTGVFAGKPRCCEGHNYCETVDLGATLFMEQEVDVIINMLRRQWIGSMYDLLKHNCCNFADTFCRFLDVGPVPDWVLNLAGAGAALAETGDQLATYRSSVVNSLGRVVAGPGCCRKDELACFGCSIELCPRSNTIIAADKNYKL